MPTLYALLSVALAGFALSASPGPSMLYVLSQSVGQSRTAGLASALGLCLGGVLLAIGTAFGLATVFAEAAWLLVALRYAGSTYLVWLGIGIIRSARGQAHMDTTVRKVGQKPILSIVSQGVLVELLNPKTVLFFALFLPPFVTIPHGSRDSGNLTIQLLVLGSLVPLTALPSDILVALMGSAIANKLNNNKMAREILAWCGGLILISIAVSLLF